MGLKGGETMCRKEQNAGPEESTLLSLKSHSLKRGHTSLEDAPAGNYEYDQLVHFPR